MVSSHGPYRSCQRAKRPPQNGLSVDRPARSARLAAAWMTRPDRARRGEVRTENGAAHAGLDVRARMFWEMTERIAWVQRKQTLERRCEQSSD